MKKQFIRGGKGFTLIELVIVIAVLGILGGLAISRYQSFAEESRGAIVLGNMRTIESAAAIYAARHGELPTRISPYEDAESVKILVPEFLAEWPVATQGVFKIRGNDGKEYRYQVARSNIAYAWNGVTQGDQGMQRATLGRWTIDNLLTNTKPSGKSLINQLPN